MKKKALKNGQINFFESESEVEEKFKIHNKNAVQIMWKRNRKAASGRQGSATPMQRMTPTLPQLSLAIPFQHSGTVQFLPRFCMSMCATAHVKLRDGLLLERDVQSCAC